MLPIDLLATSVPSYRLEPSELALRLAELALGGDDGSKTGRAV
jgi:hypothetical protein